MPDYMTWQDFKTAVTNLLPLDRSRLGVQDLIQSYIRMGVIDLMDYIPRFRKGHEVIYYQTDFAPEGQASVGALPPWAVVRDCYVFDIATKRRDPVIQYDWKKRFNLVYGRAPHHDRRYRMASDPQESKFYIFPLIEGPKALSMNCDGMKLDFQDNELIPMEEDAALAVADFVVARIAAYVERDVLRKNEFASSYAVKRRNLALRMKG